MFLISEFLIIHSVFSFSAPLREHFQLSISRVLTTIPLMQKITPFLWFDGKAEEAAKFYVSIFKKSKILQITRYGDVGPGPKGAVMSVTFQLEGQKFYALNGGPEFKFTPAVSFFVDCKTQAEIDRLWKKLTKGGKEVQCGWLTDKYGISWQIVPTGVFKLLNDKNPAKSKRVMEAMFKMVKLDLKKFKETYAGK
jgi:predicted 3-demethylubiquinone-9 3-methyltransferase (glyoxalase superfamily)